MDFQTLESDGQHLCQLCGEMKENVIKGRPDFITLVKRTLGYINIEFIDDIILGKWLCANCLVDAESADTFLCKVEEGQRKLRQQIPEGIGTLEHIKIEKSEEMPIVKLEPDNTEYTVTEAVATPTCAQFSEDNHAMCFIEKEDYDMDNNTDMLCAKNSMTYSNHLDNETTETEEAPSHSQTSLNYTATTYIKTEDYPLNNHTASSNEEPSMISCGNKKLKSVEEKPFKEQVECKCVLNCATKITIRRQEELYNAYYMSNYAQQVFIIKASVTKKRAIMKRANKYLPACKKKTRAITYQYGLTDHLGIRHAVCRTFFVNLYQLSTSTMYKRVNGAHHTQFVVNRRGLRSCKWKTAEEKMQFVKTFINSLPSYESHYGRQSPNAKKYLKQGLNFTTIFGEYVRKWKIESSSMQPKEQAAVSRKIFSQIFKKDFNLSFKSRPSNRCNTCEHLSVMLRGQMFTEIERNKFEADKRAHNELAQQFQQEFSEDIKKAKHGTETVVLSFDLQKALETPSIPANIASYKHQLWTYSLCICNEANGNAYMYVWSENVASRGGQEIGSCFIKCFRTHLSPKVKHIILYSDPCIGQNRSIKITLLLKHFLANSNVDLIEQKYFLPGHSYNSCHRQFAVIEKAAKAYQFIETPDKWIHLFKFAKPLHPFIVTKMECGDFISVEEIKKLVINSKKDDVDNGNITINKKNTPVDALKMAATPLLYPLGRPITIAKFNDLMELMKFIDPQYRQFYKNLQPNPDIIDYGLASGESDDE